jgi:4-alpha-glucanotransferase
VGDLGPSARRFLDWLADAGVTLWQILPLVPPGPGESPYATTAALAGNPWLIDLEGLAAEGLLTAEDLVAPDFPLDDLDSQAMKAFKAPRLARAADALLAGAHPAFAKACEAFRKAHPWVDEAALFIALKADHDGQPWWLWGPGLPERDPAALAAARKRLAVEVEREAVLQFLFDHQWQALRQHAANRGIRIIGDVPIYVDRDSVDVWANRDQFRLDEAGNPVAVAGVPPDFFSDLGQLWGNPLYDWERMAADGHAWWVRRLRRARELTDFVRLDHFRGFAAFWEVPADAPDARGGRWVEGPGRALFDDIREALGELPLIAEDLGVIDEPVVALRDGLGLPGMRVLQFAFGEAPDHPFLPHNYVEHTVAYTATHDNNTTLGWWQDTSAHVRDHVRRYLAVSGQDVVWDMIRATFASVATMAIVPLQDVLCLDGRSRMNSPGVGEGNWGWRVRAQAFNTSLAARLRALSTLYGRAPAK